MLKNKTVLKIVSLVIAIFLWIYVMGEVDPETKVKVYGIEVNYINTELLAENGLAVAEDEPVTINATIEGKRSDVNKAKKKRTDSICRCQQMQVRKKQGRDHTGCAFRSGSRQYIQRYSRCGCRKDSMVGETGGNKNKRRR